ncbi:MAG: hypothetical protein M1826_002931 [Phylliscum demangeonii]|nr:MAG: hypothetical protein M1826_002931 [Phylliscum demangeonii]
MKSWMAYAVAVIHLLARPVKALPRPSARPDESSAGLRSDSDNDGALGILLGGGVLFSAGLLGGASLRQAQINQLKRSYQRSERELDQSQALLKRLLQHRQGMQHQLERPRIMLKPHVNDMIREWKVPPEIAGDPVWMECIYEHLQTPVGGSSTSAWALGDAIVDCANYHGRPVSPHWFNNFHRDGAVRIARSEKRATAWAEREAHGWQARQAAPDKGWGHFRKQTGHKLDFETAPLAVAATGRVPHWASRLESTAQHLVAGAAASARRLPASYARWLHTEGPALKNEVLAAY